MLCDRCQRVFFVGAVCPWCGHPAPTEMKVADPKTCKHEDFEARVGVHRFEETGTFLAEICVRCAHCQLEFSFTGLPLAISTDRACLNIDGTVLSLPIEPGPKPIPVSGVIPVDVPRRKES